MMWFSGKDMNLSGGVPTWLNSMSGLESLSLWGNDLSGPIPRLTGMTSLVLLKIQSNRLSGGVPAWLGDMSSTLDGLYIHGNPLGGTIPPELGRLTRLRRLWIHSSNLTGTIPAELANMSNLGTLNLRGNGLTGNIPTELGRMSRLQDLLLHDNQLTGTVPSQLGDLSSLRRLWLSQNQLTGSIPSALGGLPALEHLNLHTNDLSGGIPSQLGNLSDTLTRLRIGGYEEKDENDEVIRVIRGNTGLTGCVPRSLSAATDADDLRLGGGQCRAVHLSLGDSPRGLKRTPAVERMNVRSSGSLLCTADKPRLSPAWAMATSNPIDRLQKPAIIRSLKRTGSQ